MSRLVRYALAALALALVCCAAASAEAPEFGRCIKQVAVGKTYHGKYRDSKCTKAVTAEEEAKKGKFEWEPGPGVNNKFVTTGGAVRIEQETAHPPETGKNMTCTSEQSSGEFVAGTDNKAVTTTILFKGCKSNGFNCTSNGFKSGEVETHPLVGEAGWENNAKRDTALALRAAPGQEGFIFQIKCVVFEVDLRGGVLALIKNDKMTEANTLKYAVTPNNVQKPRVWHVGEASEEIVNLESNFEFLGSQAAGLTMEMMMKGEEPLELNAVV